MIDPQAPEAYEWWPGDTDWQRYIDEYLSAELADDE